MTVYYIRLLCAFVCKSVQQLLSSCLNRPQHQGVACSTKSNCIIYPDEHEASGCDHSPHSAKEEKSEQKAGSFLKA